jgi:hypothetical protein
MTGSKQKLLELEKEGKYLFHGSPESNLEELKPHQAYTVPEGEKDMVKDGEPCIAATPYLDIAIFKALITKGESSFSVSATSREDAIIKLKANEEAIETAKNTKGCVYVLDKIGLVPISGNNYCMEWRSKTSVKPLRVFEVSYEDLPANIEIIK